MKIKGWKQMKKQSIFLTILLLVSSPLHADILPSIGRGLARLQEGATELFLQGKDGVQDWWESEGRDLFEPLGNNIKDISKETWNWLMDSFAQINQGYRDYWEEEGIALEDQPPVEEETFLYSFMAWWQDKGEPAYEDIQTGYCHYIENFSEYRQEYYAGLEM